MRIDDDDFITIVILMLPQSALHCVNLILRSLPYSMDISVGLASGVGVATCALEHPFYDAMFDDVVDNGDGTTTFVCRDNTYSLEGGDSLTATCPFSPNNMATVNLWEFNRETPTCGNGKIFTETNPSSIF